jgi:Transketolase
MNQQHATAGAAVSTSGAGLGYRDPSLARPVAERAGWQEIDVRAVDTARLLAADAVQKAGSGHPGTAMSLAPLAYLLFQNVLVHDPADEQWLGRDRFVLSAGHTSLTLYIQLFLSGYGLEIGDLEALRTWGSKTPGHPEYRHTRGVEITTGPLGQGLVRPSEWRWPRAGSGGCWTRRRRPGRARSTIMSMSSSPTAT